MAGNIRLRTSCAAALVLSVLAGALSAQEPQDLTSPAALTVSALQARLAAVQGNTDLADADKEAAKKAYDKALEFVRAGDEAESARARFAEQSGSAASDLDQLKQLPAPAPQPPPPATTPLAELEALQVTRQAELTASQAALASLEQNATRRTEQRTTLPVRIPAARAELSALEQEIATASDAGGNPIVATARQTRRLARQRALQLEIASAEQELLTYAATEELQGARRDRAARTVSAQQSALENLKEAIQRARTAAAQQAKAEAEGKAEELGDQHPLLVRLAEENKELAQRWDTLNERHSSREKDLSKAQAELDRLQQDFLDTKKRVDEVGLTETIGVLLRNRRGELSSASRLSADDAQSLRTEMSDTQLGRFDVDEQRRPLLDAKSYLDGLMDTLDPPVEDARRRANISAEAATLLEARRVTLDQLRLEYPRLFELMVKLGTARNLLEQTARDYRAYVNERVLWIRSSTPLWGQDLSVLGGAVSWISDLKRWGETIPTLLAGLTAHPSLGLWVLMAGVLLAIRPWSCRRLKHWATLAGKGTSARYAPTAWAVGHTILNVLPLPLLILCAGTALEHSPQAEPLHEALGVAAVRMAWILAAVILVRQLTMASGLGSVHFFWEAKALAHLRRRTTAFAIPFAASMFLVDALEWQGYAPWIASLGRLALLAALGSMTVLLWCLLRPGEGILARARRTVGPTRWQWLWFLLGVGISVALVLLVILGYGFTTIQLLHRLEATLALAIVAMVTHGAIVRALFLAQRRLAIERAEERRRAAKEKVSTAEGKVSELPPPEEIQIDPSTVALQARKLVRAALWVVVVLVGWRFWVDVVPALGALREVVLWSDLTSDPVMKVSLAHLLLSLLLVLLTILVARNVPGLLELAVLQRIGMPAGERTAFTTLVRYAIYVVGFIAAFSAVGIGWSKVQWLIAAMSLGLGFGLQEIFANFVSGLILLFERPIRVGDTVTVGDTVGRVTRIRIRATTITDWDRRELIVPNREFVTSRFVNWTLSDPITRVVIPVGIAYGSDTELARGVMLDVVRNCRVVLDEPKPKVVFRTFGESSLDFEVRVFLKDLDDWPQMMNEVHTNLDARFREVGIEIPFPQRDLHVRSAEALVEHLGRSKPGDQAPPRSGSGTG